LHSVHFAWRKYQTDLKPVQSWLLKIDACLQVTEFLVMHVFIDSDMQFLAVFVIRKILYILLGISVHFPSVYCGVYVFRDYFCCICDIAVILLHCVSQHCCTCLCFCRLKVAGICSSWRWKGQTLIVTLYHKWKIQYQQGLQCPTFTSYLFVLTARAIQNLG